MTLPISTNGEDLLGVKMEHPCLCIDVGGTSIKYALINSSLELQEYGKVQTPYEGLDVYIQRLERIFESFKGRAGGIGMSVPGRISPEGVCISAGNLKYADGLDLAGALHKRCGVPVTVMNDAKCAALAEAKWGALRDCKDGIAIILGTGIGGAIVKDRQIHMGAHYSAGELSFVSMSGELDDPSSMWYGQNGNFRLIRMAARAKNIPEDQVSGEDIFRWVEDGDPKVCKVLDRFTAVIARMIFNLQIIYDPERFVIGGGISRQPSLLEYINKNLDFCYQMFEGGMPKAEVTTCQFFNEANLLGAFANFLNGNR